MVVLNFLFPSISSAVGSSLSSSSDLQLSTSSSPSEGIREIMATATATATRTAKSNRFRFAKQQLCRCITFFIHFFAVTARVRREMPYFTICRGRQLSFFLPELWYSPLELNSSIWQIKRDGISANSLFEWRFRTRRRRCCFSWLLMGSGNVGPDPTFPPLFHDHFRFVSRSPLPPLPSPNI